jgi:hypothetical protein
MTSQTSHDTPQSLWRAQADRWLSFAPDEPPAANTTRDDPEHDPPPAAPAMPPWPRVVPGL